MNSLIIQGDVPLNGEVTPSGSAGLTSWLISLSLFSSEEVVLTHVPNVPFVKEKISLISSLGVEIEWTGDNRIIINSSGLSEYRVPFESGSKQVDTLLLVAPLIFKFGKAIVPLPEDLPEGFLEDFIKTWESLGMSVNVGDEWIKVEAEELTPNNISFKNSNPISTISAISSAVFVKGESVVNNACERAEVDELISFFNSLGGSVKRTEPCRIEINGETLFKGVDYEVTRDIDEIVHFAVGALITGGTVAIRDVNKVALAPFINILNKIGTNFEFLDSTLTSWHGGEVFEPVSITAKPAPGFLKSWVPAMTLLLTQAPGESYIRASLTEKEWSFVSDLNRLGADIVFTETMSTPIGASTGSDKIVNPDSYREIKITGPSNLKGNTLDIVDFFSGPTMILASLSASGRSVVRGYDLVENIHADFIDKLASLGANIEI